MICWGMVQWHSIKWPDKTRWGDVTTWKMLTHLMLRCVLYSPLLLNVVSAQSYCSVSVSSLMMSSSSTSHAPTHQLVSLYGDDSDCVLALISWIVRLPNGLNGARVSALEFCSTSAKQCQWWLAQWILLNAKFLCENCSKCCMLCKSWLAVGVRWNAEQLAHMIADVLMELRELFCCVSVLSLVCIWRLSEYFAPSWPRHIREHLIIMIFSSLFFLLWTEAQLNV